MLHDPVFAKEILGDRKYVNYPEIIEFYTGSDGRRVDAVESLITDTAQLVGTVDNKIGIDKDFNPYEGIVWDPSDQAIEAMRAELSKTVETSNLPDKIKDCYADEVYDSTAPYDQTIRNFLHEYSITSLVQATRAASRALRNSKFVDSELKLEMLKCIIQGWASLGRVFFALAPTLAQSGRAAFDGFGLILGKEFDGSYQKKLKDILLAGPFNVVRYMKDDLSSANIGPLVGALLSSDIDSLQKHFLIRFLISERPTGWYQMVFEHMNSLHRNSFYLWALSGAIKTEVEIGFTSTDDKNRLKRLRELVAAKHIERPHENASKEKGLRPGQVISSENKLPIDKIRSASKRRFPR